MVKSFISTASKKVTDVRSFLRDAASGSSIKYTAEKGAKHQIYIPFQTVNVKDEDGKEVAKNQVIAISGDVHDWVQSDGRYRATICLKDIVRRSEDQNVLLNDGSCSFCDRVSDGWDIYRYRKELEEATCKLTGKDREKHFEKIVSNYADERKAKEARTYMYIIVVKFKLENGKEVLGPDKLPEYDLKVMKLSNSRVEKMQQQVANAGADLPGAELIIEYPSTDDRRAQVSQSTTAPVFPDRKLTVLYPQLLENIVKEVNKFTWEGLEKAFPEWSGMTSAEAKNITDELFEKWDEYKHELLVNPSAKYMEYITDIPGSNPSLTAPQTAIPEGLGVKSEEAVQTVEAGEAGEGGEAGVEILSVPDIPDVNEVFKDETTIKI